MGEKRLLLFYAVTAFAGDAFPGSPTVVDVAFASTPHTSLLSLGWGEPLPLSRSLSSLPLSSPVADSLPVCRRSCRVKVRTVSALLCFLFLLVVLELICFHGLRAVLATHSG